MIYYEKIITLFVVGKQHKRIDGLSAAGVHHVRNVIDKDIESAVSQFGL